MNEKDIIKQIYNQALSNRRENLTTEQKRVAESMQKAPKDLPKDLAKKPEPSAQARALAKQLLEEKRQEDKQRVIDRPDTLPADFSEREQALHEVMGVYRKKRQLIDDLPPKHRALLEKMGKIMLGVQDTKQPPKGH